MFFWFFSSRNVRRKSSLCLVGSCVELRCDSTYVSQRTLSAGMRCKAFTWVTNFIQGRACSIFVDCVWVWGA